jgi:TolB-like protein/DNA-binding SARP family transcriptional activator
VLKLKLFGAPRIERSGGVVTGRAAHGRRLALLACLALTRSRVITRDKIIALFWPETPGDRARQRLSDDLYILRNALGEEVIEASGDDLAVNRTVIDSDVWDFERRLDDGQTDQAVPLYAGPLLDGFHLPDSVEFDQWLDVERSRLAQRFATALEALAESREAGGDFASAARWWQRLASHDAGNGRVALRLMRALERTGDRAGALRHARAHAAFLREEFDAEPDPQVSTFAERLRLERPERAVAEPRPIVATEGPSSAPVASIAPEPAVATPQPVPAVLKPVMRRWALVAGMVLLIATLGISTLMARTPVPRVAASVGVLPFVNLGGDPQQQYFSDGLSEQIITALSGVGGLQVAARTSSFALRNRALDARAIGDMLGVSAVLEGSVRKDGDRLRITAQLIDASTGYHLWTGEYDRELKDVLAVQDQIAGAIAGALKLRLAPAGSAATLPPTLDLHAYDLYLRALYLRNSLAQAPLQQAEALLDTVIAREPRFALAYATQASVIAPQLFFGYVAAEQGLPKLRVMVARALELDPLLGEAHANLGMLKMFFDWDWKAAEQALRRAIALNPSDAHAYHHLANYLTANLRFTEALAARERSFALDPLNARTVLLLGSDYLVAGDAEKALAHFRTARTLDPSHTFFLGSGPLLPIGPAEVYVVQGRLTEALEEYVRIATLRGASPAEVSALRRGFAKSGMHGFWRAWIDMDIRQANGANNPVRMAKLWTLAGDTARALDLLDQAYASRNPAMIYLRSDRTLQALSAHPRFVRLSEAMGFPSASATTSSAQQPLKHAEPAR